MECRKGVGERLLEKSGGKNAGRGGGNIGKGGGILGRKGKT